MSIVLLEPVELRARGFDALVKSLGWVNAVRFIQEYESSQLNYTAERAQILPDWDAAEMARQIAAVAKPAAPGA
jgi:hypothetical protein